MKELLKRLKVADPVAYEDIRRRCIDYFEDVMTLYSKEKSFQENIDDTIQGCIQRAIAARGWGMQLFIYMGGSDRISACIFKDGTGGFVESEHKDSPALALLSAYLEAVEG